jgi:hypothetical protein
MDEEVDLSSALNDSVLYVRRSHAQKIQKMRHNHGTVTVLFEVGKQPQDKLPLYIGSAIVKKIEDKKVQLDWQGKAFSLTETFVI